MDYNTTTKENRCTFFWGGLVKSQKLLSSIFLTRTNAMIYYSNTTLDTPHMAFIGRWSPFHKGHTSIIYKKLQSNPTLPILILIRNTSTDQYPPIIRAKYIKAWMTSESIRGTIMIIPNIEGVYWGRDVGYNTQLVDTDVYTKQISGTEIRKNMQQQNDQWKSQVAHEEASYMLSEKVSSIIERGFVVWLTGCPSSGKTTIAKRLLEHISSHYPHLKTQLLDGDEMRNTPLAQLVGFTKKDRADHILRMGYLAKMFADQGIVVVCAFVSPDRKIRERAYDIIGRDRYAEIFVKASKKTCIQRDVKGLYKKAIHGHLDNLTGYNAPYERPNAPHIICDTDKEAVDTSAQRIMDHVFSNHPNTRTNEQLPKI